MRGGERARGDLDLFLASLAAPVGETHDDLGHVSTRRRLEIDADEREPPAAVARECCGAAIPFDLGRGEPRLVGDHDFERLALGGPEAREQQHGSHHASNLTKSSDLQPIPPS